MAEEYCWAMTQAERRPCCSRSGSTVLKFGFSPGPNYVFDCMYTEVRLAPDLPERNYWLSQGLSALVREAGSVRPIERERQLVHCLY